MSQPAIPWDTAENLLAEAYPTLAEALTVGRQVGGSGWTVLAALNPRPGADGTVLVATVYHPRTGESPGELRTTELPPRDSGAA